MCPARARPAVRPAAVSPDGTAEHPAQHAAVKVDCSGAVAPPGLGGGSLSPDLAWGFVSQA